MRKSEIQNLLSDDFKGTSYKV